MIFRLDYRDGMFFLTRREQIAVAFILVSLIVGAGIHHLRMSSLLPQADPSHFTKH